ncbi:SusC/RagA family TonB-linked outer membrane protein [Tellurirhabdus rosea]|uniref:SusC/RagA family TonB-linked outer membrane protein n=1 Tax=Tellurirhabdus rosea TaxID=2674997 RepID=UPI002252A235|nr:SusC/RagA family TonB-linked outer membrane protein [Tellurirhabdus rosea]
MSNSLQKWLFMVILSGLTVLGAWAQDNAITGKVTSAEDGSPIPGASVIVRGTTRGTTTDAQGNYRIAASTGQTLRFSFIGTKNRDVVVGNATVINITLEQEAGNLNEVVVTALGVKREKRQLGYAVTELGGQDLAQTQRDNFLNGLQGRVAGVNIATTSGMPGASSQVIIRGVNSISGNNQPLFVIDGMPIDNRTAQSANFVAERNSSSSFANRTVDFANRASDLNPADIETVTILKGPEAAALYGVEAANGAILITTRKGRSGQGRITYSNNFTFEKVGRLPELQQVYSQGNNGIAQNATFNYFGPKYAEGTTFYDNMNNFLQTGMGQRHNLSFEGGTDRYTYRLSGSYSTREGVIPTTKYDRLNLTLSGTAKLSDKLTSEATMQYINTSNQKVSKGQNSFMLGMLQWPMTDDMSVYIDPATGLRKKVTTGSEIENPYFDVNKNRLRDLGNRVIANVGLNYVPTSWLTLSGRVGVDVSSTQYLIKFHPESNRSGGVIGGSIDQATDNSRNLTMQYFATLKHKVGKFTGTMRLGSALYDNQYKVLSTRGEKFLVPEFESINNTDPLTQKSLSRMEQRRLVGAFGDVTVDYNNTLFLTVTGRNDWSSTFPKAYRSFFYPSASLSFVFTELVKEGALRDVLSYGKLRASLAQVGKEAPPYSTSQAYESQTTTGGGFSYGFTGPNPNLKPEKVNSFEVGTELKFFNNRLGIDAAYYKTTSRDQIIRDLRASYGTGFVLNVVNGGEMWNNGVELSLNAEPIRAANFSWNTIVNFTKTNSRLVSLMPGLPEFYMSDTWVYSNIRNGARPGGPLTTLTGNSYQRNTQGDILISPLTGLPITETVWNIVGDRNPDFVIGWSNQFNYKNLAVSFLFDVRQGGDVYNATELFLYNRGLSKRTLDRETPRIFRGVLKDGLENTATPTPNTIQVIPYYNNSYYTAPADENFIERDVNWVRLKDVTVRYNLPTSAFGNSKIFKSASVFFTGTDLFMLTNYTGGDPGVNATTATVGGSGGYGIDFGNLPLPRAYNVGISIGL